MKQWKVITPMAIVYASPDLAAEQIDIIPQGLFVDGTKQGSWVHVPAVGYVLVRCLELLTP